MLYFPRPLNSEFNSEFKKGQTYSLLSSLSIVQMPIKLLVH